MGMGELTHLPPGSQLKNMLERAFKWAKIQREAAEVMTRTWIEFVPAWSAMLAAYKKDPSKSNPFRTPDPGKTLPYSRVSTSTDRFSDRWGVGCFESSTLEGRFRQAQGRDHVRAQNDACCVCPTGTGD